MLVSRAFKVLRAVSLAGLAAAFGLQSGLGFAQDGSAIPAAPREMRGAWIATVGNIDWPSKKGLPADVQQRELIAMLDKAKELRLNAIVLQVRPMCDAFYKSELDPWSMYLSGKQGQPPAPYYDPLEFAVREAHRRGLELHAWFNPYRAGVTGAPPTDPAHIANRRPDLVRKYGKHLWLDPGEKEVQDYTYNVIMDVVKRYDIDAVHFDDYFYPYREKGSDGVVMQFPDEASYQKFQTAGGTLGRDDWRRENVNVLVKRLYEGIKATRPTVRFGISPFGIWRPGFPQGITGLDAYSELYADAKKWMQEGWVDYLAPQLYWTTTSTGQNYAKLLNWWVSQNPKRIHLWVGNFTSKVSKEGQWSAEEILKQIQVTREQPGATGNIHFSMKPLMQNKANLSQLLVQHSYQGPALVPASPWLDSNPPGAPVVQAGTQGASQVVAWSPPADKDVFLYTVYARVNGRWRMDVVPAGTTAYAFEGTAPDAAAVAAVDRVGNEGPRATVAFGRPVAAQVAPVGVSVGLGGAAEANPTADVRE